MSIVALTEIKIFLDIAETDNSEDELLGFIQDGVEGYAKAILKREPESTSYSEIYDGSGTTDLILNQYPVTALAKVSISFDDVIKIKNTSTDSDNAYVTVNSDSLTLTISGGANNGSDDLTFSSYATMSAMVTAINALAKGWDAVIVNSDYNDLKTTSLLEVYNLPCGAYAGETASYEYLYWGEPLAVEVDADRGILYRSGGFPAGRRNVLVNYTAGYSASDMPADYKLPIMVAVKAIYDRREEDGFAVASYSLGRMGVKYADVFEILKEQLEAGVDVSKGL